jgi:hypothetical protein
MTSEARLILNLATMLVAWGFIGGACGFAAFKGGPAERVGAVAFFLSNLTYLAFQLITGEAAPIVQSLFMDFAVAFTFLVLAIRYNSLWLGVGMMVMGAQFSLHAAHLMDLGDPYLGKLNLYAFSLNMVDLAICVILVVAARATLNKRRKARAAPAPAAPPLEAASFPAHGDRVLNGG